MKQLRMAKPRAGGAQQYLARPWFTYPNVFNDKRSVYLVQYGSFHGQKPPQLDGDYEPVGISSRSGAEVHEAILARAGEVIE
jgi:hypothetical protein